ncbi:HAD family hydrolase [Treponema sp. OMZ 840]|uniref:HAD family hydrolase n=1 Tax=Treponema sp. OMZ 840 TaxID=244313 RepID=UPI003D8CA4DE
MKSGSINAKNYTPKHDFLVCIDSDGCAFDTMEIKHKECFCPAAINAWNLQPVSSYAREAWEFVNLYSTTRGCSRFHAMVKVLDFLAERKEVKMRNFKMPEYDRFKHWVDTAPILNNDMAAKHADDPQMARVLNWSLDTNKRIAEMVHGIPPFPFVRESLEKLFNTADIVIVSATAREALLKEWHEHKTDQYISLLGAQEDGSKQEIIAMVKDHYKPDNCLMIGDAPGDHKAAVANGILFFPIYPLNEISSWEDFYREGIDLFISGKYKGNEMNKRYERFMSCLPDSPPWLHK